MHYIYKVYNDKELYSKPIPVEFESLDTAFKYSRDVLHNRAGSFPVRSVTIEKVPVY